MTRPKTDWQSIARNSSESALVTILGSSTFPHEAVHAAEAELARRTTPSPCPNLDKWQKELAAGLRDAYTFDELWRKACAETSQLFVG